MAQRGVYALRLAQKGNGSSSWMTQSECAPARLSEKHPGVKRDYFFEDSGAKAITVLARMHVLEAVEVCNVCPVRAACLQHALVEDERGVWGGKTQEQRRVMLAQQRDLG